MRFVKGLLAFYYLLPMVSPFWLNHFLAVDRNRGGRCPVPLPAFMFDRIWQRIG